MKRLFPLICMLLFPVFSVPAADGTDQKPPGDSVAAGGTPAAGAAAGGAEAGKAEKAKTEADYIEMDIRTSTLVELAGWCRELGLSEGGTREELAARLRAHYQLPPGTAAKAAQRVITIESAKTTEYFTIDVVDEEYARLKGDVIISLKDGSAVHRIKAWEILYNRTRNVLTATGKVEYVKEDGDTVETFKGESITVNLDNWSSIFMDGSSTKSVKGKSSAYRFAGTVISRNSEDVTVLSGADITEPDNEEALWSLHASKLWLLPGNDWAILNAVLKVGNIPLLYLPFFYYPADEIVFHPVLGYRTREGTFLQTTTYILGRPTASTIAENSITKIFGGATDGDKKREGVFLRTTGAKTINPNETQLSLLFDAYVNLGAYLGTELALPGKGALGKITLSAGLGFTRDIFPTQYSFTPFPRYDGTWNYNWGMLFSLKVPFRYRFETAGSYQIKYGSFSWNIPYYSDPYVKRDFMRRSEVLDWLAMLRETGTPPPEDETAMSSYELTSYTWSLNGSLNNLPVTSLNPYVQSFSISPVSISLVFNPRDSVKYSQPPGPNTLSNPLSPNLPNPGKSFFVPSRFTIYNISASVTGTPFAWGNLQAPQLKAAAGPAPGDTLLPDAPLSPWDTGAGQGSDKTKAAAKAVQDTFALSPPALSQTFPLTAAGAPRVSVDYSFSPSAASELQFRSNRTNWKEQEDINWGEISTVLSSFQGDGNLGLTVSQSGGSAYSGYFRLRGRGSWQDYVYLNEKAEELSPVVGTPTPADIKKARDDAYTRTNFSSSWDLSASMKPFYQSPVWNATSLQYSLQGILGKTTVDTTGNSPKWDWVNGKWDKDNISSHQITANLGATVMDYAQNISVSAVLPPRDSSLSTNATFRAWITETSFRNQIQKPLEDGQVIGPVYLTETLNFGSLGSFRQDVVFDPKQNQYTTFTSSLTLSGFLASFSAVYAYQYRFNPLYGSPSQALWSLQTNQALEPQQFRLGYSKTFTKTDLWGKRLNFSVGINTDLSFDLQRYTNSRFSFLPAIKLQVAHFLDLTFSTRSENGVMYRYFQKWPLFRSPPSGFPDLYAGYETNFFKDLFNSFRFDNADIRRKSGFKLRSLDLSLTHYLGSWVATLTMSTQPYLAPGSRTYKFTNNISFLIQWNPIGEIKAQIDYNQDGLKVK